MTGRSETLPATSRKPRSQAWWNAVNAWLLLLPAAVLLAAFTHYPILATIRQSLYFTKRNGTEVFVGLDNYRAMAADPIFWKALINNFWFALGTIPTSIALALLMALWVNRNMRGRGFLRLAYFTPTGPSPALVVHTTELDVQPGAFSAYSINPQGIRWK